MSGAEQGKTGPARSRVDAVYGAVGAVALLFAAFFAVRAMLGPGDEGRRAAEPVPVLELLEPADGATVTQPFDLVFDAGAALRPGAGGWEAGGRHLHLGLDGGELMPAAAEIRPAGGTRYAWTLSGLAPGAHTLRLFWSDAAHRPLAEGASRTVTVTVR